MPAIENGRRNADRTSYPNFFIRATQIGDNAFVYTGNGYDGNRPVHIDVENNGKFAFMYAGNVQDNAHGASMLYAQHQRERGDTTRGHSGNSNQPPYVPPGSQQQWAQHQQSWLLQPTASQHPGGQQNRPQRLLLEQGSEQRAASRSSERNADKRGFFSRPGSKNL